MSCNSPEKSNVENGLNGNLEHIKVDLGEASKGKLSEFFEPEIDYIWLKDDSEDAQLEAGLHKILLYQDRIFTMDIYGCRCLKVFDRQGNFLNKVSAYGEGPGQYLDFDDFIIVKDEILLLGVYPRKLMWFAFDGVFQREQKLEASIRDGVFSKEDNRYFFLFDPRDFSEYQVLSVDENLRDSIAYFPYGKQEYYGNFSDRDNFQESSQLFLGRAFNDTITMFQGGDFVPKFVFDYGKYRQSLAELKDLKENLDAPQELDFMNNRAKLYFETHGWFVTEAWVYAGFRYERKNFNVFFDRKNQKSFVRNWILEDDIDGGFDPYSLVYNFGDGLVGNKIFGRDLFKVLQKKKSELSDEDYEKFIKGQGKNFATVAYAARESENPVLIVYRVKK